MAIFSKKTKEEKEEETKKDTPKKEKAISPKNTEKKAIGKSHGIIVKPLITEKAAFLGQFGQYVFEVTVKANKIEIAKAIEKAYGVRPLRVNIIDVKRKNVRYGKVTGKTKRRRKAVVFMPEGVNLEIYEGV